MERGCVRVRVPFVVLVFVPVLCFELECDTRDQSLPASFGRSQFGKVLDDEIEERTGAVVEKLGDVKSCEYALDVAARRSES